MIAHTAWRTTKVNGNRQCEEKYLRTNPLWTLYCIIPPCLTGFVMEVTSNYLYVSFYLFLPCKKDLCLVWSQNTGSCVQLGHLQALCWNAIFPGSESRAPYCLFPSAGNEITLLVAQELLQVFSGCNDSQGSCRRWLWWSMAPMSHRRAG